jgi:lipid IVA palmitoyltransferase
MGRRLRLLVLAAVLGLGVPLPAAAAPECADLWSWLNTACRTLADTYKDGKTEVLVSGWAWHTPWTWTAEKRREENAFAWGGGLARSRERENGDTDIVYWLVFSDSHYEPEYNIGYGWSTYWGKRDGVQAGLGYTAMIIQRRDIANGWPFPAVLPLFSARYDRYTLYSTYIPNFGGGINHGSVFYAFGMIHFD